MSSNFPYVEIVVARYNESLEWTLEYPFNQFKYTVYNKGVNDNFDKTHVDIVETLPNVGRCDHTYLYHIVSKYFRLKPITVFFPGSVQMQTKKDRALYILNHIITQKRAAFYCQYVPTTIKQHFANFKLDEWSCSDLNNKSLNGETSLTLAKIRPYHAWYSYWFKNVPVNHYCLYGIFSLHRADIIKHNINRYKQLLNAVEVSSNPEVGHYIERSWGAIFEPIVFTNIVCASR
jgi:hypothetical protein